MTKNKKILNIILLGASLSCLIGATNQINTYAFSYEDKELIGAERRKDYGSNYWLSSNLREWLNSNSQTVRYTCNPPSSGYVNSYPYDKEAGFLTGFTQEEQDAIAITERGNVLGANDGSANTNGKTSGMPYNHNNSKSMNFEYPNLFKNWNNYGKVVANDKIFLLTSKEVYEYVQNRGWEVTKNPSVAMAQKYGYTTTSTVAYNIYHPIHNIGNEYLQIVSSNKNSIALYTNAKYARGLAPALNLKPDANVKRIKEYNINSVNESWTTKTSTVKASDLNIGDIVEFGSHLGEKITWRVINKTSDGYPLLFSEKVIDIKAFDASGDTSRRFSYIDLEDKFPVADTSMVDFQLTNIQGSADTKQVSMELLNEDKLFERSNDSFIMNLKISDDSGIAYLEYPNGNKVNINNTEYSFDYEVSANGNYVFGLMDVKGNFRYFVLPVGNINLPPKVDISSSTTAWTNQNVTVDIKATNDVGWNAGTYNQSKRDSSGGSWGNYTTYIGKRIRITGTVEYVSDKNNFNPSSFYYGPGVTYKKITKSGDEFNINWTWPLAWQENLNTLKQNTANGIKKDFDVIYTVGSDYFGSFSGRTHINLTSIHSGNVTIKWSNLKYELLDNDDFAITKIELPTGNSVNVTSYKDTITTEGETVYSYKVHDNRNMITEKTITARIDKSKPTISITGNPTSWTNKDVTLKLSLGDNVSGINEIVLPNGRKLGNNQKQINMDYVITENGSYTFTVIDQAGNQISQTVNVSKIDKKSPVLNYTIETNTNKTAGTIKLRATDYISGIKEMILPDGTVLKTGTYDLPISNNGQYPVRLIDNTGNEILTIINVNQLTNSDIVPSDISRIEYKLSGATVKDWTVYDNPFYITNEGITTITARSYDKAGNLSSETTSIAKIDKTKPVNNGILIELKQ